MSKPQKYIGRFHNQSGCFSAQYLIHNKQSAQCNNRNYIISPFAPYKQRKSEYDNAKYGRLIKCHKPYALIISLSVFSSGILSFIFLLMITKGYRYSTSIVKQLKIFFHLIRKLESHTLSEVFCLPVSPCSQSRIEPVLIISNCKFFIFTTMNRVIISPCPITKTSFLIIIKCFLNFCFSVHNKWPIFYYRLLNRFCL